MRKILLLLGFVTVLWICVGCSNTHYKYEETTSNQGDWIVTSGDILIGEQVDQINFSLVYNGETAVSEDESWSCELLLCEDGVDFSVENAKSLCSTIDVYGKAVEKGGIKNFTKEANLISSNDEFCYDIVFLKVRYVVAATTYEDIIEVREF